MNIFSWQPSQKFWTWLLIAWILLLALAVRSYMFSNTPFEFVDMKQFQSFNRLFEIRGEIVGDDTRVPIPANAKVNPAPYPESPLFVYLVLPFTFLGLEDFFALSRLATIAYWFLGALALADILRRQFDLLTSAFGLGLFLLLPYSVMVSRAFFPEPFMISFLLLTCWSLMRWRSDMDLLAIGFSATLYTTTIFIKPYALPILVGGIAGYAIWRFGLKKAVLSWPILTSFGLGSLLCLIYYTSKPVNSRIAAEWVIPELAFTSFFYLGWYDQLKATVGFPLVLLGLLGALWFRGKNGFPGMVWGLLFGYAFYCFTFTRTIATHHYYHAFAVVFAALLAAPVLTSCFRGLYTLSSPVRAFHKPLLVAFAALLALHMASEARLEIFHRADGGARGRDLIAAVEEVKPVVSDPKRVVFADPYFGYFTRAYTGFTGARFTLNQHSGRFPVRAVERRLNAVFAQRRELSVQEHLAQGEFAYIVCFGEPMIESVLEDEAWRTFLDINTNLVFSSAEARVYRLTNTEF